MKSNLNFKIVDEINVIEMSGQFTGGEETELLFKKAEEIIEQGEKFLIIDLSDTTFISSIVLGNFVKIHSDYTEAHGKFIVTGLNRTLENVFKMTKLGSILNIKPNLADAIKSIKEH